MNKDKVKGRIEEVQGEAKETLGKIRKNLVNFISAACVFFLVFSYP